MLVTVVVVMAAVVVVDVVVPVGSTGTHQDHKELAPNTNTGTYTYTYTYSDSSIPRAFKPMSLNIKTH